MDWIWTYIAIMGQSDTKAVPLVLQPFPGTKNELIGLKGPLKEGIVKIANIANIVNIDRRNCKLCLYSAVSHTVHQ